MRKILVLLSFVFLFLLLLVFYFTRAQKTGEFVRSFDNITQRSNYVNKEWYLIGKISIENGKVANVTYFEKAK